MSICPISNEYSFTYEGVRADDGGTPEELIAVITKYGVNGDYSAEDYDTEVDNDFTFIATNDGTYNFKLTGAVSGLVMNENFIVDFNTRRSISQLVKEDVDKMMCGGCDQGCYYVLAKALLASSSSLFQCGEMLEANNALDRINLVLKGGCPNKLCGGGC